MNKTERQRDLLKIIEQIDISPTMFKNAVEKYNHIAEHLNAHGLVADFYPQGSFALGTVTRPYLKDKDKGYDLDFICEVHDKKENVGPKEIRDRVEDALMGIDLDGGKLHPYDECFTIDYDEIRGIGFSIDIVPAVAESELIKAKLRIEAERPDLIETAIAIPRFSQQKVYNWITNNPRGYLSWFNEINEPYKNASGIEYRQHLFDNNRTIYSSIDDIPAELDRTPVQRVIQILKYHRDVYYSHIKSPSGEDIKPISAIINTLVSEIASNQSPYVSTFELLDIVLNDLAVYEKYISVGEQEFKRLYRDKVTIQHDDGKWRIENPANPADNLANKWNENSAIPSTFFRWIRIAREQLIDSLALQDAEFRSNASNAFGARIVENVWGKKYMTSMPEPIHNSSKPQPWRKE